eukprot:GHVH01006973.1.p1 GENE.GHVH01006973.1~~GHVH01006973.1.p1  ORF type:complete len:352 (+),score=39.30 GHVH01006973.1:317-1372(+)
MQREGNADERHGSLITTVPISTNLFTVDMLVKSTSQVPLESCYNDSHLRKVFYNCPYTKKERLYISRLSERLIGHFGLDIVTLEFPTIIRLMFKQQVTKTKCPPDACVALVSKYLQWKKSPIFPIKDVMSSPVKLRQYLEQGCVYWLGRAQDGTPALVFDFKNLSKVDASCFNGLNLLQAFCMEWGLNHLLLPGVCERIHMIMDVRGVTLASLPIRMIQTCIVDSEWKWPVRGHKTFVLHNNWLISTFWKAIEVVMDHETKMNVHHIHSKHLASHLSKYFSPEVLFKSQGGNRDPPNLYYPFPFASGGQSDSNLESKIDSVTLAGFPNITGGEGIGVLHQKEFMEAIQHRV